MCSCLRLTKLSDTLAKFRWPSIQTCQTAKALKPMNIYMPAIQSRTATTSPPKPKGNDREKESAPEVKFKDPDLKKVFKDFYSLYGPLFICCHIGISLCSVGLFYTIVWFTVDPLSYLPEAMLNRVSDKLHDMTNSGGKFVIAYAIHKAALPLRLPLAIILTKSLSKVFKFKYQKKA